MNVRRTLDIVVKFLVAMLGCVFAAWFCETAGHFVAQKIFNGLLLVLGLSFLLYLCAALPDIKLPKLTSFGKGFVGAIVFLGGTFIVSVLLGNGVATYIFGLLVITLAAVIIISIVCDVDTIQQLWRNRPSLSSYMTKYHAKQAYRILLIVGVGYLQFIFMTGIQKGSVSQWHYVTVGVLAFSIVSYIQDIAKDFNNREGLTPERLRIKKKKKELADKEKALVKSNALLEKLNRNKIEYMSKVEKVLREDSGSEIGKAENLILASEKLDSQIALGEEVRTKINSDIIELRNEIQDLENAIPDREMDRLGRREVRRMPAHDDTTNDVVFQNGRRYNAEQIRQEVARLVENTNRMIGGDVRDGGDGGDDIIPHPGNLHDENEDSNILTMDAATLGQIVREEIDNFTDNTPEDDEVQLTDAQLTDVGNQLDEPQRSRLEMYQRIINDCQNILPEEGGHNLVSAAVRSNDVDYVRGLYLQRLMAVRTFYEQRFFPNAITPNLLAACQANIRRIDLAISAVTRLPLINTIINVTNSTLELTSYNYRNPPELTPVHITQECPCCLSNHHEVNFGIYCSETCQEAGTDESDRSDYGYLICPNCGQEHDRPFERFNGNCSEDCMQDYAHSRR